MPHEALSSVRHALVRGYEILDVDEGIFSTVDLEELQGLNDEVANVGAAPLRVVDAIALIQVVAHKDIEHR